MRSRVSSTVVACVAVGSTTLAMAAQVGPAQAGQAQAGTTHAASAPAAGHAGGKVKLVQVSHDPYKGDGAQHASEAEPDTFAWGRTVVSVFQVGRFGNGGATNTGW